MVEAAEAVAHPLSAITGRRAMAREGDRLILWVDARTHAAVGAWTEYMPRVMRSSDCPRVVVSTQESIATDCLLSARLRLRKWSSYVTKTDSRVLAERAGRRMGNGVFQLAMKSAVVAELAVGDLEKADSLVQVPLDRLIGMKECQHGVWAAQVAVLLPLIEQERRRALKEYEGCWRLPHTRADGKTIRRLEALEIGDLALQSESVFGIPSDARKRFRWLSRMRNALAHANVVPWGTLINPTARTLANFAEEL
ncbi:MAG: hypothetical protein OXH68_14405 [Gammaproteobacteria bacterium]|nr:hypothetical protein [Gammaproteobacteria bacterium]